MAAREACRLSVVIPAWNEEEALPITLSRLIEYLDAQGILDESEIVVVSDGSSDSTVDVAVKTMSGQVHHTIVDLAKNVGSHAAIRCGLRHVGGENIVVLSSDGQDPPEIIGPMLDKLSHGFDIVWGEREARHHDPMARRTSASSFYWFFRKLTGLEYPPGGLDFVAFGRHVNSALDKYTERNLPLFLLIYNLGYRQALVPYARGDRVAGVSGWNFAKRAGLAIDMITAFSAAPMRMISLGGSIVGLLGLTYGAITVVRSIVSDIPVSGWSSMIVLTAVMSGTILLGISTLGEYVWRSLDEARRRPIFLEREVITSDPDGHETNHG